MAYTFSVILPIYKQDDHIEIIAKRYISGLRKIKDPYELLFIVNGPSSLTPTQISQIEKVKSGVKVLKINQSGWGKAVKFGISKASGEFICYTNSARTDVEDLYSMLTLAQRNYPYVIKANRIIRDLSTTRKIGSILYNLEFRVLSGVPVWDVNGTPKVFPRSAIKKIKIKSEDDLIDAEIVWRVFKNNHHLLEFPVFSNKRVGGKSSTNFSSAFKMYFGILNLRKLL